MIVEQLVYNLLTNHKNSKLTINNDSGNVDVDKNMFPQNKLGHGKYAIDIINDSGTVDIK